MSDLYLVLRSRLEPVGKRFEWVDLGPSVMLEARKRLGLSREAIARKLNLSAKTYERYEKSGQVPKHELRNIAGVLELQVEETERTTVVMPRGEDDDVAQRTAEENARRIDALEDQAVRVEGALAEIHEQLRVLLQRVQSA